MREISRGPLAVLPGLWSSCLVSSLGRCWSSQEKPVRLESAPGEAGAGHGEGRGTHMPSLPPCHVLAMTLFQVVDCWTSCCLLNCGKDGEKALGGFHEGTDSTAGTQGPTSSHHHRTGLGFDIGILGRHKHWVHEWIYERTSVCFYQSLMCWGLSPAGGPSPAQGWACFTTIHGACL